MPPYNSSRNGTTFISWFVPGYMISRQVMLNNLNYFLGPQATVRPFTYQQREGYLINNPGGPLTKGSNSSRQAMIDTDGRIV